MLLGSGAVRPTFVLQFAALPIDAAESAGPVCTAYWTTPRSLAAWTSFDPPGTGTMLGVYTKPAPTTGTAATGGATSAVFPPAGVTNRP